MPGKTARKSRHPMIIPGDWGKSGPGWLAHSLESSRRKPEGVEAGFTSSSGGVRAPSVTRQQELGGQERSETAPSRVTAFRLVSSRDDVAVTQRVHGCYCEPARSKRLWRVPCGTAQRKTPKGGTKGAFEPGRTRGHGRPGEKLPKRRRCAKTAPLACESKAT